MPAKPGLAQSASSSYSRPGAFLDLVRDASSQTLKWTCAAVALAWLPLAILSGFGSVGSFQSFLTDYATQSRFLLVIPVLILSGPALHERRSQVAQHIETFLVPRDQYPTFHADWSSTDKLRDSWLVRILIAVVVYATVIWLDRYLSPQGVEFTAWWKGSGGLRFMSLAGTWAAFVSYPIVFYLGFLWLWRQLLWLRFLRLTTRLNLQLIAAHPDGLGGLGFIEGALRAQLPFAFCLGVGLAGAVANRIFHDGEKLVAFRHLPLILIAAVLLICVAPYFLFTSTLMRMRRHAMLRYGAFARAVGEQFEKKWLDRANSLDEDVLEVPDFSTTTDLYGVVNNINNIRVIPVGLVDLYALVIGRSDAGNPGRDRFDPVRHRDAGRHEASVLSGVAGETGR